MHSETLPNALQIHEKKDSADKRIKHNTRKVSESNARVIVQSSIQDPYRLERKKEIIGRPFFLLVDIVWTKQTVLASLHMLNE